MTSTTWIDEVAKEYEEDILYNDVIKKLQLDKKYIIAFRKTIIRISQEVYDLLGKEVCIAFYKNKIIFQGLKNTKLSLISDSRFIGTFYYFKPGNVYFMHLGKTKHAYIKIQKHILNLYGDYEFIQQGELLICKNLKPALA